MNKKIFLKELEKKLQILNEEERNDILNEYKDTIEEKIKHGSSEEEAVNDFGSVEELSREILKAYKINPDFGQEKEISSKEKVKHMVEQSESWIKKSAHKLSNVTKDFVEEFKNSNHNWSLELIFEIVIKAIILLIGLAFLRVPFYFIDILGNSIFGIAFPPFNLIFTVLWKCFIGILYFLVCIVIAIIVFRPYFENYSKKETIKKKEKNEKVEHLQEKEKNQKEEFSFGKSIKRLFQGILCLFVVLPFCLIDFGCYVAVAASIFLLIQGVPVVGILLISIAFSIFFTFLTRFFYSILYGGKKVYCYSLILSAILFIAGCFFFISTVLNFQSYSGLPENDFEISQVIYQEQLKAESFTIAYRNYEKEVNDDLQDGEIEVVVSYYSDFVEELKTEVVTRNHKTYMHLEVEDDNISKETKWKLYHMIIDQLKKPAWYDYRELRNLEIIVRANQNTIDKIG